jgi:hypothetical protein
MKKTLKMIIGIPVAIFGIVFIIGLIKSASMTAEERNIEHYINGLKQICSAAKDVSFRPDSGITAHAICAGVEKDIEKFQADVKKYGYKCVNGYCGLSKDMVD